MLQTSRQFLPVVLASLLLGAGAGEAKTAPKRKSEGSGQTRELGLGGGILIVFPPMITFQGSWQLNRHVSFGAEAGYVTVPLEDFSGTSTYMGIDGKGFIGPGGLYGGLSLGRRSFEISTVNNLEVNGVDNEITWTRTVSQTIVYPKAGWMRVMAGGHSVNIAVGYVMPMGTSFAITRDKDPQGGLPPGELATEEEKRVNDVKKVTNVSTPSVEFKYAYFIDVVR